MDMSTLRLSLEEARNDAFETFEFGYQFRSALVGLWGPESGAATEHPPPEESAERIPFADQVEEDEGDASLGDVGEAEVAVRGPTSWSIAFTAVFRKSVADADRKLQGRILLALTDLSENPTLSRGDTKKPLVGEFKGLWRYRLGDYRLLYEPRAAQRLVVLVGFSSRGSAYEP